MRSIGHYDCDLASGSGFFFLKSEMNLLLVNYNVALFSALEWVHVLHTLGWILEKGMAVIKIEK